jgi:galactoside O-acetyltransferase
MAQNFKMALDDQNMGENIKGKLKRLGKEVKIYPLAKIVNPEVVEIGDYSMIDDFTFINGGKGIKIGRYVHIASFVSIIGGGELILGDYADIACGARILTGSDTYHGGKRMTSALPLEQRNLVRGKVIIEKDAFIGTNVVVHPNVRIGEGAVIGSNSLVLKDIEPWSVNVGSPCKKIGDRPKVTVPDI